MLRHIVLVFAAGIVIPAFAQTSSVNELFQTDADDATDREILFLEVTYPPGAGSGRHRHDAHTIVYVLEGAVIMQVAGGERKTLTAGQVFYETPDDIHSVSMNASDTAPARILVYFLKQRGAPVTTPVP
ncbi:MAG: cupin domain-containing protein [Steroidobacteraceae bacterium]